MQHNKIVGLARAEQIFQLFKPFATEPRVNGIKNGNFFVDNHIRIISHAVGNGILPLKQIRLVIVYADIVNIFADFQFFTSFAVL